MSSNSTAFINTKGVDITAGAASTFTALPYGSNFLLIKNVGTNEAFVTASTVASAITASAASAMSIPAGATESFRSNQLFTGVNHISTAGTTLRVYATEAP